MNDTLLMILIVLMSLTLLVLTWAVIALLVQLRRELPAMRQRMDDLYGRLGRVLDETADAMEEVVETMKNLHIVSDNIRHKVEVTDEVASKVRRLPEKMARSLGRLMHRAFELSGQLIMRQLSRGRDGRVPSIRTARPVDAQAAPRPSVMGQEAPPKTSSAPTGAETASLAEANQTEGGMNDEPR
jgi:uncharacterized protein YoxC